MVRHGGLCDVAACGEVARAHAVAPGQLPEDREAGGIGGTLEEQGVGVDESFHAIILTSVDGCGQDA